MKMTKELLFLQIHNHLVRVQWAQGEASRPKSGLSFLLKNPKVVKFLILSALPRQERKDKNILMLSFDIAKIHFFNLNTP